MAETIPDVTLARCGGQVWLLGGEEHLDALLINDLPPHVTVELVEFESRTAMYAMWEERSSESTEGSQPWALNPMVTKRLLGALGLVPAMVQFTPWSAMLDPEALEALEAVAAWLRDNPDGTAMLRQFAVAKPAPGHSDLQRLRGQLVMAALLRLGADPVRIREDIATATTAKDAEQLLIVTAPSVP